MSIELLHIPYSPWSEKARWALEARGVPYRSRYYSPLLGEPELRIRLRRPRGVVSVPVLFTPAGPLADSLAIARHAAASGSGPDLFPAGSEAAMGRWVALSEDGLAAGRKRSLERVLASPEALREMVPKGLRSVLGPLAVKIAAAGVRRTLKKYGSHRLVDPVATLRAVSGELRYALGRIAAPADDGPKTLLPTGFSFADIAIAQALAFVSPPSSGLRIGPANREAFTDPEFAPELADLIAWRDALYLRYRQAGAS